MIEIRRRVGRRCRASSALWGCSSMLLLALACEGSTESASESGGDAGLRPEVSVDAPADTVGSHDAAEDPGAADAEADAVVDAPGEEASVVTCRLETDGTCSPSASGCEGCHPVHGLRFDLEDRCLLPDRHTFCTTNCTFWTVQKCYQRSIGEALEVILLSHAPEDEALFEAETGLSPCGYELQQELASATPCADDCPIEDDACTEGCAPSMGSRFDEAAGCFLPSELLLCHDIYETPPAQALPMAAPDGTCWLVNAVVHRFQERGWTSAFDPTNNCDGVLMQSAGPCP